jgi:hypothetical protein
MATDGATMAVRATVNAAQLAEDPILLQTLQYSIAKSILSSYSGEFDWLAEVLQNSVDSLQRRWKGASAGNGVTWTVGADPSILPDDLVPRLRVIVYRGEDAVVVVDNGTGMGLQDFASLAVPFATDKGEARERGQKGVGLKYLIYGHNAFALASKIAGVPDDGDPFSPDSRELHEDELRLQQEAVAAGMSNDLFGVASAGSTRSVINAVDLPLVSAAPPFPALDLSARLTPCLAQVESGVAVEIGLDAESEHGRLSRRFFSSNLSRWQHVLRTKTAVGHVDIDQDLQRLANVPITRAPDNAWLDRLVVELFVVEGSRVAPTAISYEHIRPEFEYPHTLVPPAVVERCRNLRGSNTTAQYEALYEHWTEPEFAGEFDGYLRDRIASLGGNPDDATADEHLADPAIVDELRELRQVPACMPSTAGTIATGSSAVTAGSQASMNGRVLNDHQTTHVEASASALSRASVAAS